MRAMHGLLYARAALSFMQCAIKFKCRQETARPMLGYAVSLALDWLPADCAAQEVVAEGGKGGALAVVLAIAMAASGGLVEIGFVAHRLQLCPHLAGMPW